jgi:exonuclease SbcC
LSDEERASLEQQIAAAQTTLEKLDAHSAAIELHLRWHQDAEKFAQSEQAALSDLQEREQESAASIPRQRLLEQLDQVQSARPLFADITRLQREIVQDQATIEDAQHQLLQAQQAQQQAQAAFLLAQSELQNREQEQAAAAVLLDQAKALDASIEIMLPAHQALQQNKEQADLACSDANTACLSKQNELGQLQKRLATRRNGCNNMLRCVCSPNIGINGTPCYLRPPSPAPTTNAIRPISSHWMQNRRRSKRKWHSTLPACTLQKRHWLPPISSASKPRRHSR